MEAIVLYPCPGMGHLLPMLELSKLIHTHNPSLFIHILINDPPINLGSIASQIAEISTTIPSITFHHLPTLSPPLSPSSFPSLQALIYKFLCLTVPQVRTTLQSLSLTLNVRAFVPDILCSPAAHAAASLFIPTYYFFTAGTSCLSLFLYFPTIHNKTSKSFKDSQDVLYIPSLPPIPSSHMPEPLLDRTTVAYAWFLDCMTHLPNSLGIIVNTFEEFESKAFKAISDGLCVPNKLTPPISCVGPLTQTGGVHDGGSDSNIDTIKCLKWLNSQPSQSVVFLCFGSLGIFSREQLKEIAVGLEKSGQRFLWVVRNPEPDDDETEPDPDLSSLLPCGFLERTKERGMVVKSWAPQVVVLNHNSVGGFVTHCGWNSVLESVRAGVPMVAWPLYAEQKFNKIVVVEELNVALAMEESEGGVEMVSATEVERRVRELMESEKGKWIRESVVEMQSKALKSTTQDGSSWLALDQLIHCWTTP